MLRFIWKNFSLAILLMWLFSIPIAVANSTKDSIQKPEKRHVLVLNAYNKGYKWTDNEVQGIEDSFANDSNVILHIEYMDTKVINEISSNNLPFFNIKFQSTYNISA